MFEVSGGGVSVNGHVRAPPRSGPRRLRSGAGDEAARPSGEAQREARRHARDWLDRLGSGHTLVAFAGLPVVTLDRHAGAELIQQLSAPKPVEDVEALTELTWLPRGDSRDRWLEWLSNPVVLDAECQEEFEQRATEEVGWLLAFNEGIDAQRSMFVAEHRLESLSYPLTILAMLLVTFAVGHLLSSHSLLTHVIAETSAPGVQTAVHRSLLLVVACAGLDFVWTWMASQAGMMKELNPIGSGLIHDPLQLLTLKAAWWACVVNMLLVARWVVFSGVTV